MAKTRPFDTLTVAVALREHGKNAHAIVTPTVNGEAVAADGPALAGDLFPAEKGPLESDQAVALIGRCSVCADLDCGYADVLVSRFDEGVSWCVRSFWIDYDVEVQVPKRFGKGTRLALEGRWKIDAQRTYWFEPTSYDAVVAAARLEVERLESAR